MVKIGKLVQKFENRFFQDEFPKKMVKQITSQKSALNQTFVAENHVVSSLQAWELDESHRICLVAGGVNPRA
jgi:hypothetical protein